MNNQSTFDKLMRAQTFATWSLLWAEVRLPTHVRTRLIGWLILHLYQSSSAYARPLAAACLAPLLLFSYSVYHYTTMLGTSELEVSTHHYSLRRGSCVNKYYVSHRELLSIPGSSSRRERNADTSSSNVARPIIVQVRNSMSFCNLSLLILMTHTYTFA